MMDEELWDTKLEMHGGILFVGSIHQSKSLRFHCIGNYYLCGQSDDLERPSTHASQKATHH